MNLEYKDKYLKYKSKYNKLKKQFGGTIIITSETFKKIKLTNINENDFKPLECTIDNNIILENKKKILLVNKKIEDFKNLLEDKFSEKIIIKITSEIIFNEILGLIKIRIKHCYELIEEICNLIEKFTILCVDCDEKFNLFKSFLNKNLIGLILIQDKLIGAYTNKIIEYMSIDEDCCKNYKLIKIFKFKQVKILENINEKTKCLEKIQISKIKEKNKKHKEVLQLI